MKRILGWATLTAAAALGLGACEGPAGVNGQPGASCTVVDNGDGTATVTCGSTQVVISDGASCEATDNGDGTSTIDCGAGGSVTVSDGEPGLPGAATATVTGTVTNTINSQPVAGLTVGISPKATDQTIVTDASGVYTVTLPIGSYTLSFGGTGFKTVTATVALVGGVQSTVNAKIAPTSSVFVTATPSATEGDHGASIDLTAAISAFDGSTATAYQWTQLSGPAATISNDTTATATVVLGDLDAQFEALVEEAHIAHERLQVVGISPYGLEESEVAKFQVAVTTSTGTYKGVVSVHMPAPAVGAVELRWTSGIRTVPMNVPVLVHAPGDGTWAVEQDLDGAVTDVSANLVGAGANRAFVPTAAAKYTLTFTPADVTLDPKTLTIYAGTWRGAITGINADSTPRMCGGSCHNDADTQAAIASWTTSGHAHIFTNNFNTPGHYGTNCMECHAVGLDEGAVNGGIDEAASWDEFLTRFTDGTTGAIHSEPTNYAELWATETGMTDVARFVNIQCENCHGPNDAGTHTVTDDAQTDTDKLARIDMGSQVCGFCHGEPARHGRYQQWQLSGHGNVELAIEESAIENRAVRTTSVGPGHCGRCHSAQGFVAWVKQAEDLGTLAACIGTGDGECSRPDTNPFSDVEMASLTDTFNALGMNADNVQPITCVACHDPHAVGTFSGEPNNATVRVSGSTPKLPSGFYVTGAGKGALCMTCHNTRNGLMNDATWVSSTTKAVKLSAPHHSAQADVLMGENAFYVEVGERSVHANVQNSCVDCHMNKTPPPAQFSYNLAGTNHDFSASTAICANCHTSTSSEVIQASVQSALEDVRALAGEGVRRVINSVVTNPTYDACTTKYFVAASVPEDGSAYADWSTGADWPMTEVPVSVEFAGSIHGQPALALTFAAPVDVTYQNPDTAGDDYTTSTSTLLVTASSIKKYPDATCAGTLKSVFWGGTGTVVANAELDVPSDALAKAIWNTSLIDFDGSLGVHNPPFAHKVLGETYAEIDYWTNTVLAAYK